MKIWNVTSVGVDHFPCVAMPKKILVPAVTEFVALKSLVTPTAFKSALLAELVAGMVAGLVPPNSNALTSEITSVGKVLPVKTSCPDKPTLVEPVGAVNKT